MSMPAEKPAEMPAEVTMALAGVNYLGRRVAYMTSHIVHYGLAADMRVIRQATLDAAFVANPTRFKSKRPQLPMTPTAAWINPHPEEIKPSSEPVDRTLNYRPRVSQSH